MISIKYITSMSLAATLALGLSGTLFAQHSDIEFEYAGGAIALEFGAEGRVFEGDFSDFGGGPDSTDDPGFGSEQAEGMGIDPEDILGYNVVGPLLYHNGVDFAATSATLTVESVVGLDVPVDSSTTSGSGLIGQAGGSGDFHSHIDYTINSSAPNGAYGVLMTLSAFDSSNQPKLGIADSDRFYIVFNRGLEEEPFEGAVADFAALIPEPASLVLGGMGALALILGRRRSVGVQGPKRN